MTFGRPVFVVGVGMDRFGQPGRDLGDRAFTAGIRAMEDAALPFADIGVLYLASAMAPRTFGVGVAKDFGLTGLPILTVENASATGAAAFHEAVMAVSGGRTEVAMALGFDDPSAAGGFNRIQQGVPVVQAATLPAAFFSLWAVRRMHDRGTSIETLALLAAKNWNAARFNEYAERQSQTVVTKEQVMSARMIAYPHTSMMAAPQGGGAAAVIVASADAIARLGISKPNVRVAAAQAHSERFGEGHLFAGAIVGPPEMAHRAAYAAYDEAGIGPDELSVVAFHDAYAIEELLYYEQVGLCEEGDGDRLVHDGDTALGGRIPVSTDGGFIGRGHPGGPTGLAQIWELTTQLRGRARERQVDKAQVGLAHIVGAGSVCYTHILVADGA